MAHRVVPNPQGRERDDRARPPAAADRSDADGPAAAAIPVGTGPRIAVPATTAPALAEPVPATPEPTPTPALQTNALGTKVDSRDGRGNVTVFAYKQPVAAAAPRPDQAGWEWGAIDVQVCVLIRPATV